MMFFLVGTGEVEELPEFHTYLNSLDAEMQFTLVRSKEQTQFLDTTVFPVNNILNTRLLRKDTDRNRHLKCDSRHPRKMVPSPPYSRILREKQVVCGQSDLDTTSSKMADGFQERGYPQKLIDTHSQKVKDIGRQSLLHKKKVQKSFPRLPFVSTLIYDPI